MKKPWVIAVVAFVVGVLLGLGTAYKILNKPPREVIFQLSE